MTTVNIPGLKLPVPHISSPAGVSPAPPPSPFSPFSGLNTAPVFERGNPLKPGEYDVEVTRVLTKQTYNKGPALIVELKVLTVNPGNTAHNPGDQVSWFQKLTDPTVALPSIKEFLIAACGMDYKRQKAEVERDLAPNLETILMKAINEGALNGQKVHVSCFQRLTKKNTDFTVHNWTPYTGS